MISRFVEDLHPVLAYAFGWAEAEWIYRYPDAPTIFLAATYRNNDKPNLLFATGRTLLGSQVRNAKEVIFALR